MLPEGEVVYAIGDVHGAHAELRQVLIEAGIIDNGDRWTGGTAHLVSVGDLLDRGDDSRAVMDLLLELHAAGTTICNKNHTCLLSELSSE